MLVQDRDDLYLRYITLLNCVGRYNDAYSALMSRKFHPWEGGEGKTSSQYRYSLIHMAIACMEQKDYARAIELLNQSKIYPDNLGEGKLPNVPDNEADYYMGIAYKMMNNEQQAKEAFERAVSGPQEPGSVLYYNDQPSDFIYYQGLAQRSLGNEAGAIKAFNKLIAYGEKHLFDTVEYDFFAVSLPEIEVFADDISLRNSQYCNYMRALGNLGLGNNEKAQKFFDEIINKQPDYQGALAIY